MATYFVSTVKIERVDQSSEKGKRVVGEALHITVKAENLARLTEKVNAHMALVDEDDI